MIVIQRWHQFPFHVRIQLFSDKKYAFSRLSSSFIEEPAWLQGWDPMVESECRACPPGRFSMQIPKGFQGDTAICRLEPQFLFVF